MPISFQEYAEEITSYRSPATDLFMFAAGGFGYGDPQDWWGDADTIENRGSKVVMKISQSYMPYQDPDTLEAVPENEADIDPKKLGEDIADVIRSDEVFDVSSEDVMPPIGINIKVVEFLVPEMSGGATQEYNIIIEMGPDVSDLVTGNTKGSY